MNWTTVAAWVGGIGTCVNAGWNVYTKLSAGPKLKLSACADMIKMPSETGTYKFIKITLHNRGTSSTTVNNVSFHSYPAKWWKRKSVKNTTFAGVLNQYQGPLLPTALAVGGEWVALVTQQGKLDELVNTKEGLWVAVHHSFAKKPTQIKVFKPAIK